MKGRLVERFRGRGKISCNPYFQQRNQIYYETVGLQIFWKTKNEREILGKGGFPLFCNSSYIDFICLLYFLFYVYFWYFTQICTLKFRYIFYTFFAMTIKHLFSVIRSITAHDEWIIYGNWKYVITQYQSVLLGWNISESIHLFEVPGKGYSRMQIPPLWLG